jgi:hypothetical protein
MSRRIRSRRPNTRTHHRRRGDAHAEQHRTPGRRMQQTHAQARPPDGTRHEHATRPMRGGAHLRSEPWPPLPLSHHLAAAAAALTSTSEDVSPRTRKRSRVRVDDDSSSATSKESPSDDNVDALLPSSPSAHTRFHLNTWRLCGAQQPTPPKKRIRCVRGVMHRSCCSDCYETRSRKQRTSWKLLRTRVSQRICDAVCHA